MKKKIPFFPEAFRFFVHRICHRFLGGVVFSLGAFLLLVLCSIQEKHVSTDTASIFTSKSIFLFMNYLAGLLLQMFGLSAFIFSFVLMSWGILWIRGRNVLKTFYLTCLPFLLIVWSLIFSFLPEHKASFSWCGILGYWISSYAFLLYHNSLLAKFSMLLFLLFLGVPLFLFVLGWQLSDWVNGVRALFFWISAIAKKEQSKNQLATDQVNPDVSVSISMFSYKDNTANKAQISVSDSESIEREKNITITDSIHFDSYIPPNTSLLICGDGLSVVHKANEALLKESLLRTVQDFGIQGSIHRLRFGPVVTLYEFEPAPGIKASRIIALANDIARGIGALSVRIGIIPGQKVLGIEVSNPIRHFIRLRDVFLAAKKKMTQCQLPLILGVDISGTPQVVDLALMPHLLMAGTTGSGKSVCLNAVILSLLFSLSPKQCRLIMIDPKMLELSIYRDIPHLLTPVVIDSKKASLVLKWAVKHMEERYALMSEASVRNINSFNKKCESEGKDTLPYIVIIIDEMADLMIVSGKEIEAYIQRLAQMARAAGIHLIAATQRPSVDVITGTIKANFVHRISFKVTSKIDSRTILGEMGAEQLLGKGDMLYLSGGGDMQRIHGPFVEDKEVELICNDLRTRYSVEYISDILQSLESRIDDVDSQDPLFEQAVEVILAEGRASTSFIQRYFKIGYNRAARLMESMEKRGILSHADNSGRRQILIEKNVPVRHE